MSARALLLALRPRQWTKNLLVVAAPTAAGVLLKPQVLLHTLAAFVAFCLAASAGYLVNDTVDAEVDRAHPVKRMRPIASGSLSVRTAGVTATALFTAAFVLAGAVSAHLLLVVLTYVVIQLGYCFGLKREPVIELGIVSAGFVLRATAGGVANHVPLSHWFLMAGGFGSLYVVAGKRYAEARLVERTGIAIRPVLSRYTPSYLRFAWTVSAAMLMMTYALWAFAVRHANSEWTEVSVVPFVFAVLRFAVDIDNGDAGEPESMVFHSRALLTTSVLWAAAFVLSVYS